MKFNNIIENKYYFHYLRLIKNSQIREVVLGYSECHHIIPKSLGGSESKYNKVLLTAKEHYVAHHLLLKFTTGKDKSKMFLAFRIMCFGSKLHIRDYKISSIVYNSVRLEFNKLNPWNGKDHSGKNNGMFGRKFKQSIENTRLKIERQSKEYYFEKDGEIIRVINLAKFCRDNNLHNGHMNSVWNEKPKRKSHKGYMKAFPNLIMNQGV